MHDHTRGDHYDRAIEHQEQHAVSRIVTVHLDENTHTAYAIHHTDKPKFADEINWRFREDRHLKAGRNALPRR